MTASYVSSALESEFARRCAYGITERDDGFNFRVICLTCFRARVERIVLWIDMSTPRQDRTTIDAMTRQHVIAGGHENRVDLRVDLRTSDASAWSALFGEDDMIGSEVCPFFRLSLVVMTLGLAFWFVAEGTVY